MSAIFADAALMLHKASSPVWVVGLSCEDNGMCGYDACQTANQHSQHTQVADSDSLPVHH